LFWLFEPQHMATFGSGDALCAGSSKAAPPSETLLSETSSLKALPLKNLPSETLPSETSPLKGLQDVPIHQYKGIRDLQQRVQAQSAELQAGHSKQQYLVFQGVTKQQLAKIDRERDSIGWHTRITHYTSINLLIIKLTPSVQHELAHSALADLLTFRLSFMGFNEPPLNRVGAARFDGNQSSKEGDSAYKPDSRNRKDDWPTIVFESGFSETLTKLRNDAQWWLTNSQGDVRIVVIVLARPEHKTLRVEKWCLAPPQPRRSPRLNPGAQVPTRVQEILVTQNPPAHPGGASTYTVTGAPLTLEFQEMFLRAPAPPESDVTFTTADLSRWATRYWNIMV